MEELFIGWLKEYGYAILFLWSIVEGEMGLIMGGIMSHTGDMQYFMTVLVAGLGGFTGDQIYFYVGRFNKGFIQRKLHKQRLKFAIAHLLLKNTVGPLFLCSAICMVYAPSFPCRLVSPNIRQKSLL